MPDQLITIRDFSGGLDPGHVQPLRAFNDARSRPAGRLAKFVLSRAFRHVAQLLL